ncbi:unnamed protein product, partial [Dicrocoelium dendriticum]
MNGSHSTQSDVEHYLIVRLFLSWLSVVIFRLFFLLHLSARRAIIGCTHAILRRSKHDAGHLDFRCFVTSLVDFLSIGGLSISLRIPVLSRIQVATNPFFVLASGIKTVVLFRLIVHWVAHSY